MRENRRCPPPPRSHGAAAGLRASPSLRYPASPPRSLCFRRPAETLATITTAAAPGGSGEGRPAQPAAQKCGIPTRLLILHEKNVPKQLLRSPLPNCVRVQGSKRTRSFPVLPIPQLPVIYDHAPRTALAGTGVTSVPPHTRGNRAPTRRVSGLCHTQDGAESPSWGNHTVLPPPGSRSAARNGPGGETAPRVNGPRCAKREARGEGVRKTPLQTEQRGCHTQHGRRTEAEVVLGGRDIGIERCGLAASARRTLC